MALAVPKGPRGEKRPADVVGCAVHIASVATDGIRDTAYKMPSKVWVGRAGARARESLTMPDERSAIARKAATARLSGA